jgi:hypothetical protein
MRKLRRDLRAMATGVVGGVVEVDAEEIDAGGHDVGGVEVLEVDDGLDHGQFVGVEDALLAGDVQDGLELLFGEGFAGGAEEVGEAAAGEIEGEAEGGEEAFDRAQDGFVERTRVAVWRRPMFLGPISPKKMSRRVTAGMATSFAVGGDPEVGRGRSRRWTGRC